MGQGQGMGTGVRTAAGVGAWGREDGGTRSLTRSSTEAVGSNVSSAEEPGSFRSSYSSSAEF